MKVRKWIGLGDFKTYEEFVKDWHYFLEKLETALEGQESDSPFFPKRQPLCAEKFLSDPL